MIVYSKENCPACDALKANLKREGVPFTEKLIGKDISREDFMKKFPTVRTVPYVEDVDK